MEPKPISSHKEFFDAYSSDPAAAGIVDFLFDRPIDLPPEPDFSNAHTAALAAFASIRTGEEGLFRKSYEELSRRQPRTDAPWLLNDPLLYGLVLGLVRFGGDKEWLKRTLRFRADNTTGEARELAETLSDILVENWGSTSNLRPVVLMARYHLGLDTADGELLNDAYRAVAERPFPYHESPFLNVIYLRAFDVALLSKAPEDPARRRAVEHMITVLWKRAGIAAWILWLCVLALFLALAVVLVMLVKDLTNGELKEWIEALDVLGIPIIAALPCVPWFSKRRKIVDHTRSFILRHFVGLDPGVLVPTTTTVKPRATAV